MKDLEHLFGETKSWFSNNNYSGKVCSRWIPNSFPNFITTRRWRSNVYLGFCWMEL